MPDRAEEDHAGHLAEQLEEGHDETHRTHYVESGHQPHLNGGRASFFVPELLVTTLRIQATTVSFSLHAARIRNPILLGPRLDLEPIRVVAYAAAMKLDVSIWNSVILNIYLLQIQLDALVRTGAFKSSYTNRRAFNNNI